MPYGGNLVEQPSKLIDVFDVFDKLEYDRAERKKKSDEAQAKRKAKPNTKA